MDFELEIRSTDGGFETRVLGSPWGRVAEPFSPPFEPERLEVLLRKLEGGLVGGLEVGAAATPEEPPLLVEGLGGVLARHLLPGRVGHYLYGCLGLVEGLRAGGREVGLRLRICFDREESFAPLAALPWELLFLDPRHGFVNRDRRTPVVRYLDAGNPAAHRMPSTPRVLLVDSAPMDLDTKGERRALREALSGWKATEATGPVVVESYEHPTLEGLRERLLEESYNVLHFMGHGGFDRDSGQGYLCFETADRLCQPVDGRLLGEHLRGIPGLRLVVLNACWSGVFPRREAQDPFSGVAAELTRKGIPAVVAMQFPVTDPAAITFSRKLYERLAAFDPVDAAVTEARLAIWSRDPASLEWATPVLFLGVEDGRIFERTEDSSEPVHRGGPEEETLRLEIRAHGDRRGTGAFLDLRPLFQGPHPRDPRIWRQALVPRLQQFLATFVETVQPVELHLAVPGSLAFLAGSLLDSWSALDVTVIEESLRGELRRLSVEPGPPPDELRWREEPARPLADGGGDVALAVQIDRRLADEVERFLPTSGISPREDAPVGSGAAPGRPGRLVPWSVCRSVSGSPPEADDGTPDSSWNGADLWQLAQRLSLEVRERWAGTRRGTLHLFVAAPAAFLFYLGQLARDLGRVQLYESERESDGERRGTWRPSLAFPLDEDP